MPRQPEQNTDRYFDIFPTKLRELLAHHPSDGHMTTHLALGEAVGVRQQTISQYASGQTQPTADVALRIARFFGVSVDYLLTGVSSYNKEYTEELGLSDQAVECLKKAKNMYPQTVPEQTRTMPYLDELLSDKEFYEFLDALYYYADNLKVTRETADRITEHFKRLDIEGYFTWELQMYVQDFIQKEIKKLGLDIKAKCKRCFE